MCWCVCEGGGGQVSEWCRMLVSYRLKGMRKSRVRWLCVSYCNSNWLSCGPVEDEKCEKITVKREHGSI